jgi:NhaA family Na+:H+ antiporter
METKPYPLEAAFRGIVSPFERFLARTSAGGIVLVAATAVAVACATFLGQDAYDAWWEPVIDLNLAGGPGVRLSLHGWINEGLMALFFLVVGLEIKRETQVGELSTLREAALPAAGAAGGVLLPASIYAGFNGGTAAIAGWAVPTATDIAFAVGVLVLMAERVPRGAIVFMTALAIADDLFAVAAIALFYAHGLQLSWLQLAAALMAAMFLCNRAGIRHPAPYALLGAALWYAMLQSGVHSTLAGLLTALAIPARSRYTPPDFLACVDTLRADLAASPEPRVPAIADALERAANAVQSPLQRIEHRLTPWVAFVVVPLFALANAGIDVGAIDWRAMAAHPVPMGVAAGLWLGKPLGIAAFAWVCVRLGLARLPAGVAWRDLAGCAWIGGIGFTMSLFIGQLAFADAADVERARLGTVVGSTLAVASGVAWILVAGRKPAEVKR